MSVRCFIAIELPPEVRHMLHRAGEAVRAADERWRGEKWVSEENLHVTLKFVGHIPEESIETLIAACSTEVATVAPFEIGLSGVRAVPAGGRARMLWGTFVDESGRCGALAEACERAALDVGAEPEIRTFVPHVTLVRARRPRPLATGALEAGNAVATDADGFVSVRAASVFRSTLGHQGPTYTVLRTCPLAGEQELR